MSKIEFVVTREEEGMRLDRYLASRMENISRNTIQKLIRDGRITLSNGKTLTKPSYQLQQQQIIVCRIPSKQILTPREIPLSIIYEDEFIVVVDKHAGVVVHPGAGNTGTTLVEGLLVDRDLPVEEDPARPGIVHRLDKDTSGVMVIAKTHEAMAALKAQFAKRGVCKLYLVNVEGIIKEEEGFIDAPIGRDALRPRRMTITPRGRRAQTEFRVIARTTDSTLLMVHLLTGRTHQIRVHMRYIGHPIIGDALYGHLGARLMLHAWRLKFIHPKGNESSSFTAPLPPEFFVSAEVSLPEIADKFQC